MSFADYLVGAAELALILVSLGYGARRLRSRFLPAWDGAPARLAEIVIAVSALLLIIELLGTIRLLYPVPLTLTAVAAGLATRWIRIPAASAEGPEERQPESRIGVGLALTAAFIVAMHWATAVQDSYAIGMFEGDSQWYHLPYPARFLQEGAITDLHFASRSYLSWFHPLNSELFHGAGMVLFDRDILSPLLNLVWLAVGLLAAWCIGRPFGAAALTTVAAAVAFDLPVFAAMQPGSAMSDTFGVVFVLASIAILMSAWDGGVPPGTPAAGLVIAGLAAGLAAGAKIVFLAPVAALTVGVVWLAPHGQRMAVTLFWLVPVLVTGAFWYLRNFAYALNPLPYVSEVGPIDLPGPDQGLNAGPTFSVSDYLTDGTVWSDWFLPGLHGEIGPLWYALVAAAFVGVVVAIAQREQPLVRVAAAAAVIAFVFYLFAPAAAEGPEGMPIRFRSGLRVFEPALIIGLVLAGLAAIRLPPAARTGLIAAGIGLILFATHRDLPFWDSGTELLGIAAIAAAIVLIPVALVTSSRRGAALGAGAAAAVLAILLAWPQADDYLDDRYRSGAPAWFEFYGLEPVYEWASDLSDERIATGGVLQYGLYGEDLSNHVQLMGRIGSDHSFREITSCPEWRRAINAGDYDYVVSMPPFGGRKVPSTRWTNDPASEVVLTSGVITVFRLGGDLDPADCGRIPPLTAPKRNRKPPRANR